MNQGLKALAVVLSMSFALSAYAIDPGYHDNQEIYQEITAWQDSLPEFVRVDTIGWSQRDSLPIWAVKVSYNVNLDEDEPTVLFAGNIHAEELIGTEIVLALMDTILTHRYQSYPVPYAVWLGSLEMWFIPTINPEGHQVVMDELDTSFRKNKRDCNLNGIFDYQSGMGGDIDGVDLNRNFPLNWVHGDTFMQPGGEEYYDYFRGFEPLGESECRALWELGKREKFSFSVVWHSSRSTNFSERLFYPWEWYAGKTSPDFETIEDIALEMASRIPKTTSGTYIPSPSGSPKGNQHDSFYAYLGTFAYLIEAGPFIQSPYSTVLDIIDANLQGAYYLLNRAAGSGELDVYSQLTGTVIDAMTGEPLEATVDIPQLSGAFLAPRTCDSTYGRYRRYLMPGNYDLVVHHRGYYRQQISDITVNPGGARTYDVALYPKPEYHFSGEVRSLTGSAVACTIFITGEDVADTLYTADGNFDCFLPEGDYDFVFDSPGFVVRFDHIQMDQHRYVEFELSPAQIIFSDDFENGLAQWIADGTNPSLVEWGTEPADSLWAGGMVATESPYGAYHAGAYNWIETAQPLDLSDRMTASLRFQHWYYFEPGYDSCRVEVSVNGGTSWETVAGAFWGQDVGWGTGYADLTPYCGFSDVRIRFTIATDASMQEDGWKIDDIEVAAADTAVFVAPTPNAPRDYALFSVFPNPFNPNLTIRAELPHPQHLTLRLWDITGRETALIFDGQLPAGTHPIGWETPPQMSSGIYFLSIESEGKTSTRKLLLLK